jgi:hypothetical protein
MQEWFATAGKIHRIHVRQIRPYGRPHLIGHEAPILGVLGDLSPGAHHAVKIAGDGGFNLQQPPAPLPGLAFCGRRLSFNIHGEKAGKEIFLHLSLGKPVIINCHNDNHLHFLKQESD